MARLPLALAFAAALLSPSICSRASAQQCTATWKPVQMDVDGEHGMRRLEMAYLEVLPPAGTTVGTMAPVCPDGTTRPAELRWFECQAGADCTDIAAFKADPKNTACPASGECRFSGGDPSRAPAGCCPHDKNYMLMLHNVPESAICMQNCDNCWHNNGQGFSDAAASAVDPVAATPTLTSIKGLYTTLGDGAGGVLNQALGVTLEGCVPPGADVSQAVYSLPPFANDVISKFFRYFMGGSPTPGKDNARSGDQYTPFVSADLVADSTSGTCRLMVTLGDNPSMDPLELVSVDGVTLECLKTGYQNAVEGFLALDVVTALQQTTKAKPLRGEPIQVVLRDASGNTQTTMSNATYKYYSSLKTKLQMQSDNSHRYQCWQGNNRHSASNVVPPPTCTRTGVTRAVNDELSLAYDAMVVDKYSLVLFGQDKYISNGLTADMNNPTPPDWASGCTMRIANLKDADGNAICTEAMTVGMQPGRCSYTSLKSQVEGMNNLLDQAEAGLTPLKWEDMIPYTASDTWADCMAIVASSMSPAYANKTVTTEACTEQYPAAAQSDGEATYCAANPSNPWCTDPCCNKELQREQCCSARQQTVTVYTPEFQQRKFVTECADAWRATTRADKAPLAVTSAITPAAAVAAKETKVADCLAATDNLATTVTAVQTALECCLSAVLGDWSHSNSRYESNRQCASDSDCCSGNECGPEASPWQKCQTQDSSSSSSSGSSGGSSSSANSCFTSTGSGKCTVASSADAPEALAACFLSKFTTKEQKMMKILLTGSASSTTAQLGQAIMSEAAYETCRGDDGHRFDPNNDCQIYNQTTQRCGRVCEGPAECKTMCQNTQRCNWRPWFHDPMTQEHRPTTTAECLDASKSASFCSSANEWGGTDDITELGYCQPEDLGYRQSPHWSGKDSESHLMTQSDCDSVNLGLQLFDKGWAKTCVYAGNNAGSDKDVCFAGCSGSNGFQPPKKYECFKEVDANGQCYPGTGFAQRVENYDIDLPHDVKRPSYCTFNFWAPGGISDTYGEPWGHWDHSTNQHVEASAAAQEAWTIRLADGNYSIWRDSAAWNAKTGTTRWWEGLKFASNATAMDVCPQLGASVRLADDGTRRCGENHCFSQSIDNAYDCERLNVEESNTRTEWHSDYREGNGACLIRPAPPLVPKYYNFTMSGSGYTLGNYHITLASAGQGDIKMFDCDVSTPCTTGTLEVYGWGSGFTSWQDLGTLSNGQTATRNDNQDSITFTQLTPVPQPQMRIEGDSVVVNEWGCYAQGYECHNGERDWSSWDSSNYEKWPSGTDNRAQALANSKSHCEGVTGATFYVGRRFQKGKMDSAEKCSGEYCNVIGSHYKVSSAQCSAIGGKCINTNGCPGCRRPHHGEWPNPNDPNTHRDGLCYEAGVSASNCTATGTVYNSTHQACLYAGVRDVHQCEKTWLSCDTISQSQCAQEDYSTFEGFAAATYLHCKPTVEPRFCLGRASCEASGRCHGPTLESHDCYTDTVTNTWRCNYRTHVCVVPTGSDHRCTCKQCPQENPDCWDPRCRHVAHMKCLNMRISSASECSLASGTWYSTDAASQRTFCTANKRCEGGRSERGTDQYDEANCLECGGTMRTDGEWVPGTWVEPAMVTGGRQWMTRAMVATNTWTSTLDKWRVRDSVRSIEDRLREEANSQFSRCMYGEVGESLLKLSAVCGGASASELSRVKAEPVAIAKKKGYPGVAETVGMPTASNVQLGENSLTSPTTISIMKAIAQVDDGEPATGRRLGSGRLLNTAGGSLNDASCWSKVRNANNILVGQLLGDCVTFQLDGSTNGVNMCLEVKAEIQQNTDYSTKVFVQRGGSSDAYTYTPTTKTVTASGTHFCASVTEAGTYFCPGLAVPNWASATTDTGSTACGIVNQITQVQEEVAPDAGGSGSGGTSPSAANTDLDSSSPAPRATSAFQALWVFGFGCLVLLLQLS